MFPPAISWLLLNILSPKIKLQIRTSLLCVFTCMKHLNRVNHFDMHWIAWLSGNSSSSCASDDFLLLSSPCCVDFSFSSLPHLWLIFHLWKDLRCILVVLTKQTCTVRITGRTFWSKGAQMGQNLPTGAFISSVFIQVRLLILLLLCMWAWLLSLLTPHLPNSRLTARYNF